MLDVHSSVLVMQDKEKTNLRLKITSSLNEVIFLDLIRMLILIYLYINVYEMISI